MNKTLLKWIMGLALFGVGLSTYALAHKTGFTSGAICNLSETFSCDLVNQGPYSEIYGIPVAVIGIVGYLFLFVAAFLKQRNPCDAGLGVFLLGASLFGLAFAFSLTALEAFVLSTWCIVCLLSQGTIVAIAVCAILEFRSSPV